MQSLQLSQAAPAPVVRSATAVIVVAAFALAYFVVLSGRPLADFRALWIAGQMFAEGHLAALYPPDTGFFTMRPPAAWTDQIAATGSTAEIYPFLYPPLWAWASAKIAGLVPLGGAEAAVRLLNPLLLAGSVLIARRIAAPSLPAAPTLAVTLAFLVLTPPGMHALMQGQPQVLVAFLTVAAIERAEAGQPRLAGCALGLAAAIKVYPLLVALIWLASGRRRAAAWFAVAGAALGALSLAVAGWAPHAEFLRLLAVISNTAMVTQATYTLDGSIAQLFLFEDFVLVADGALVDPRSGNSGWLVMARPLWLRLAMAALLVAVLAFSSVRMARAKSRTERAALWPMALILLSLAGPISWAYHYLAPLAFLPMVAARLAPLRAFSTVLGAGLLLSPAFLSALPFPDWLPVPAPLMGTAVMAALAVLFLRFSAAARRACQG